LMCRVIRFYILVNTNTILTFIQHPVSRI
jgi:hypothetical protein